MSREVAIRCFSLHLVSLHVDFAKFEAFLHKWVFSTHSRLGVRIPTSCQLVTGEII